MSTVGQVIFNLQDQLTGKYLSTSGTNFLTGGTVQTDDVSNAAYQAGRFNIFETDIPVKFGPISKLGIQAPPGTKFIINQNKTIMVGRTGVYELDNDISVEHLTFVRPVKYILNESATQQALEQGMIQLQAADDWREQEMEALNELYPNVALRDDTYWTRYQDIQTGFNTRYKDASARFNSGVNGIYTIPNPGSPTAEENFEDIYNVIVDFLY